MRIDAVKHFSASFAHTFIQHMDAHATSAGGKPFFFVGEYCKDDLSVLTAYIERMSYRMSLFDFSLHGALVALSWSPTPDLRGVFKNTLTEALPANSVTFVTNHDTQERAERVQDWETRVAPWFHAHAYALILLRDTPAKPCVFFGDLYGTRCPGAALPPSCGGRLPVLVAARKLYAYGPQLDYFDDETCVGWTRAGDRRVRFASSGVGVRGEVDTGAGMAVLLNVSGKVARKRMFVGKGRDGEIFRDVFGGAGEVRIEEDGCAEFVVGPKGVGVWIGGGQSGRGLQLLEGVARGFDTDFCR